jgi:hypothetical protein
MLTVDACVWSPAQGGFACTYCGYLLRPDEVTVSVHIEQTWSIRFQQERRHEYNTVKTNGTEPSPPSRLGASSPSGPRLPHRPLSMMASAPLRAPSKVKRYSLTDRPVPDLGVYAPAPRFRVHDDDEPPLSPELPPPVAPPPRRELSPSVPLASPSPVPPPPSRQPAASPPHQDASPPAADLASQDVHRELDRTRDLQELLDSASNPSDLNQRSWRRSLAIPREQTRSWLWTRDDHTADDGDGDGYGAGVWTNTEHHITASSTAPVIGN